MCTPARVKLLALAGKPCALDAMRVGSQACSTSLGDQRCGPLAIACSLKATAQAATHHPWGTVRDGCAAAAAAAAASGRSVLRRPGARIAATRAREAQQAPPPHLTPVERAVRETVVLLLRRPTVPFCAVPCTRVGQAAFADQATILERGRTNNTLYCILDGEAEGLRPRRCAPDKF